MGQHRWQEFVPCACSRDLKSQKADSLLIIAASPGGGRLGDVVVAMDGKPGPHFYFLSRVLRMPTF